MYRIQTLNKIAPAGLARLTTDRYAVSNDEASPEGILVRSAKLHDYEFPDSLLAIARAGVGVNNIPLERASEEGIAVFFTPGANANAVKELVLCALLLGSRDIPDAISWVREQAKVCEVADVVEKGKAQFEGPELYKKTLGIIGLGAIGSLVANMAVNLGMEVYGYDPYLSVETALRLNHHVHVVHTPEELYRRADYLTIHVAYTPATEKMIGKDAIASMKRGVRLINIARGELVDDAALTEALKSGLVATYVTDFPNNEILKAPHVVAMPHLGASTPESETNCAVMAADELAEYLERGNVRNSVNLPNVSQEPSGVQRLCLIHMNVPGMLGKITGLFGRDGVNVENLSNKSKDDLAYTVADLGTAVDEKALKDIRKLPGMIRVRVIDWVK